MHDYGAGVSVAVEEHIAVVTLDRPPVNAVDRDAHLAINAAFDSLNDDKDVRVAIFTGATAVAELAVGLAMAALIYREHRSLAVDADRG